MKKIPLTKGRFALDDDEDYGWLSQWKWQFQHGKKGYATRPQSASEQPDRKKRKGVYMHRVINKTPDGYDTDHIDGNPLNNQKSNLRSVSKSQNMMNQKKTRGSSKYKGVHWLKRERLWRVHIKLDKKQFNVGYFSSENDAAKAYDKAAKKYFGVFAKLNFS